MTLCRCVESAVGAGNSRIVFATSATAGGVYTRQAQLEGAFAHEPSVARAPNGTWVMYFARHFLNASTSGGFSPCNCTDGSTPKGACKNEVAPSSHVAFMATANELEGPWSSPRMIPLLDCNLVRFPTHECDIKMLSIAQSIRDASLLHM